MYFPFVFIYFDVVAEFLMLNAMRKLQGTQANLVGSDPKSVRGSDFFRTRRCSSTRFFK